MGVSTKLLHITCFSRPFLAAVCNDLYCHVSADDRHALLQVRGCFSVKGRFRLR